MSIRKILLFLIIFCAFQSAVFAANPIKVSIAVKGLNAPMWPFGHVLKIGKTFPTFVVSVENVSKRFLSLYGDDHRGGMGYISFEITDEKKKKNLLKRKVSISGSNLVAFQNMLPGAKIDFEITIGERWWENVFKGNKKGSRNLKARAVFFSGRDTIYSRYYNVNVEEQNNSDKK